MCGRGVCVAEYGVEFVEYVMEQDAVEDAKAEEV